MLIRENDFHFEAAGFAVATQNVVKTKDKVGLYKIARFNISV